MVNIVAFLLIFSAVFNSIGACGTFMFAILIPALRVYGGAPELVFLSIVLVSNCMFGFWVLAVIGINKMRDCSTTSLILGTVVIVLGVAFVLLGGTIDSVGAEDLHEIYLAPSQNIMIAQASGALLILYLWLLNSSAKSHTEISPK